MHRALLMLCLKLLAAAPGPPTASTEREIVVLNHSERTVNELYASPARLDDWGPDRLGDATIAPGQSRRIGLGAGSLKDCHFDVQVVYGDASREERRGLDACRTATLTFDASAAIALVGVGSGEHQVLIANRSGLPIQQVLISPAEAGDWGDDRLGQDSLSVGDTARVTYRGDCLADLRVVYENRSAEERRSLDLCAQHGVTIEPGWTTAAQLVPPRPPEAAAVPPSPVSVTVTNHAGRTVQQLYLYPEGSDRSGPDRLGATPLDDGAEVVVDLLRPPGTCRYAARIVYGGKTVDQDLPGIDLCRQSALTLPPRS